MPARRRHASVHVTAREAEVLDLLSEGLCNEEIAETLGVVTGTIKHHISQASIKLDLHSRVLLASYWSFPIFRLGARQEMIFPEHSKPMKREDVKVGKRKPEKLIPPQK